MSPWVSTVPAFVMTGRYMKRKRILALTGVATAAALIVSGCSAGGQNAPADQGKQAEVSNVSLDKDGALSKGPAPDVAGSRKDGGH
jgi:peptide/nickel transport system substrate-binding protein